MSMPVKKLDNVGFDYAIRIDQYQPRAVLTAANHALIR
jgi:hypothetical protein